ncbi:MAG: hypothetical protein ACK46X_00760 [Candidatus Sericytochromatia bacterium]
MKTTTKLLGITVVAAAILAGCTGSGLPSGTTPNGQPGFSGRVTKNGNAVNGRKVFLKIWNGATAGTFSGNSTNRTEINATTDSNGNYFLPLTTEQVSSGGLFGVAYDASNTAVGGSANAVSAANLTDEVQWFFSAPASLGTATGSTVNVNFDIGWAINGFTPSNGAVVSGKEVKFAFPTKTGATKYEVVVNSGSTAGSGSKVFGETGAAPTFTWPNAGNGNYVYTAKVFTDSGVSGVQASSPNLTFTVTGAQ